MNEPTFFRRSCSPTLRDIAEWTSARTPDGADLELRITGIAPLDQASSGDLSFLDNARYVGQLEHTRAAACLVAPKFAAKTPAATVALIVAAPYQAFAATVSRLFPDALRPDVAFASHGVAPGAFIHPEARLEPGVVIDPGVVVGARAQIGSGTRLAAHAVIGPDVCIGRDCSIGPHASILHSLIGDRVILHPGVRLGQDGFGFVMSPKGHTKIPQLGRVIVQNDVEIGANSTIDRGATRDTVIGEGTKIDNLVQIAHNVTIGRHCVLVAQVGISGSTDVGDFAAIGGQAGLTGHLRIGAGAQIAAQAGVMTDVPPGEKWGGAPAAPMRQWLRAHVAVERRAQSRRSRSSNDDQE